MLGRRKRFYRNASLAVDLALALLVLASVYLLLDFASSWLEPVLRKVTGYPFNLQGVEHLTESDWLFPIIVLCLLLGLAGTRFYALDLFAPMRRVIWGSLKAVLLGLGLSTLFFYLFSIVSVNRSLLFGFFAAFLITHIIKEWLLRSWFVNKHLCRQPMRALAVAPQEEQADITARFSGQSRSGVELLGFVKDAEALAKTLTDSHCDIVILGGHAQPQTVIEAAEEQGVEVWYFADFMTPLLARPQFDEFGGQPVVIFSTIPHYEGKFLLKRLFDVCGALLLLFVFSPLLVASTFAVILEGGRPVFFQQQRTGWRGRPFGMWKLRTMTVDAEAQREKLVGENLHQGPVFKVDGDPRITRVGRFLRRYSLDELPQLLNVLRGEMSLVGPRPLPVYETARFARFRDRRRLSVLPGLTGLWQVSGRSEIPDFAEWVRLDLEYIDRWSLWLDLRILCRTVPVVLSGHGAR